MSDTTPLDHWIPGFTPRAPPPKQEQVELSKWDLDGIYGRFRMAFFEWTVEGRLVIYRMGWAILKPKFTQVSPQWVRTPAPHFPGTEIPPFFEAQAEEGGDPLNE